MRVLVTGGAGFIGSHVVDRYVATGHQVAVVDNLSTGRRELVNPAARFYHADIEDPAVAAVFEAERPQVLNHHAAQAEVRRSVEDPAFDARVNILGSLNLLTCCRRFGVTRIIYASSGGAIYGDTTVLPTPEDQPKSPASPYGISKLTVEYYLACWQALWGIRGLALRYANVYGPRQNPLGEAGVVAIFSHRLLRGEPAVIHGDGLQTRDYVFVEDVAEANRLALDHPDSIGAVNIGTGQETTVVDLFRRLRDAAGVTAEAHHGPAKPGEQRRSVLQIDRATQWLGWHPRVPLGLGLRQTVQHFRTETGSSTESTEERGNPGV